MIGTAVYAIGFQPLVVPKLVVFWCGWLVATAALHRLSRWLPKSLVGAGAIALWNLCLVLTVSEVGLEVMVKAKPSPLFARVDRNVERLVRQKRQPPGWTFLGFPFNSQGWYDDEFGTKARGAFRVVSISDSFAWGAVPHHFQFTTVCERLLPGVEVMNFGYSATGPDVYAYILRHYGKALYPDLVLVNIFVGNDLDELIEPDPHPFLRRLFDRDHLLVYKIPQRLLILRREATRRAREHALAPETPALHLSDNPLAIQEAPAIEVNRLSNVYPWLDDPRLEPPTLSLPSFLDIETRRAYSICNPLGLGDERMDRFFARIQDIIAAAGNTPIVFMIIPDEFQVEDDLWEMVQHRIPAMKLDRDQAQRALLEWFGRNGASCIDLLPHLRAVPPLEDGRRHLYHLRDTHFNRRGNEVAGRVLGETIRARYASQR